MLGKQLLAAVAGQWYQKTALGSPWELHRVCGEAQGEP